MKKKKRTFREIMEDLDKIQPLTAKIVIDHHLSEITGNKERIKFIKLTDYRFYLLEKKFPNQPIRVYESASFEPDLEHNYDGTTGWLDISIELPMRFKDYLYSIKSIIDWYFEFGEFPKYWWKDYFSRFGSRWIFTVCPKADLFEIDNLERIRWLLYDFCEEYHTSKFLLMPVDEFVTWLKGNLAVLNPIVDYEFIWTTQDYFVKDDVIKYAKLWVQKFYPILANRKFELILD